MGNYITNLLLRFTKNYPPLNFFCFSFGHAYMRTLNLSGCFFKGNFVSMKVIAETVVRLSNLPKGRKAVIKYHEESDFQLTLMEMGCIPGEPVWVEMIAPMGDPLAIQIAGYYLSIRKNDADKIWVKLT